MGTNPGPGELSEQDRAAIEFVRSYSVQHGRPPSYREVGEHLKLTYPNHAKRICDRLIKAGHLQSAEAPGKGKDGPRARGLKLHLAGEDILVPYRGKVSCGNGTENDEDFEREPLNLSDFFRARDLVAFEATGNSMRDALIGKGDILLVRENPDPPVGSLVVAIFERDLVCKKLAKHSKKCVRLESKSDGYEPIEFDPARLPSFRILGVLHSVIRKV